jgi:hypothetical protein
MLKSRNKSQLLTIFVFKGKEKHTRAKPVVPFLAFEVPQSNNVQVQNKERTEKYATNHQRAIGSFIQTLQIFDTD